MNSSSGSGGGGSGATGTENNNPGTTSTTTKGHGKEATPLNHAHAQTKTTIPSLSFISNGTGTLDLSGKVIVKAQLRDDIRRVPIHNEEITYDEIVLMMQRMFKGQLKPEDDIVLKYKDEDGDMVTINDSSDLSFAIQCCRILKLRIYLKKDEDLKTKLLKNLPIGAVRSELREMRDKINFMLDLLDAEDDKKVFICVKTSDSAIAVNNATSAVDGKGKKPEPVMAVPTGGATPFPVVTKEFDPLQQQQPVQKPSQIQVNPPTPSPNVVPVSQHPTAPNEHPIRQQPSQASMASDHNPQGAPGGSVGQYNSGPPQNMQQQQQQMNYHPHQPQQFPQQPNPHQQLQGNITPSQTNLQQSGGYPPASTPSSMGNYGNSYIPPQQQYPTSVGQVGGPVQYNPPGQQQQQAAFSAQIRSTPPPPQTSQPPQSAHYQQQQHPVAYHPPHGPLPPQGQQQQQYPPPAQQQFPPPAPPPGGPVTGGNPYARTLGAAGPHYKSN